MEEEKRIQFGDINFAWFIDEENVRELIAGEKVKPICMKPTDTLIRVAKISKEELDSEEDKKYGKKPKGSVWREYPIIYVKEPRKDWLFILCDFNGKRTLFTELLETLDVLYFNKEREVEDLSEALIQKDDLMKGLISQQKDLEKELKELRQIRGERFEATPEDEDNE